MLSFVPAAAQTGSLEVHVSEKDGRAVPGVTVMLANVQGLSPETAVRTDARGIAGFPVLRPGTGYVLRVSMPGFAEQRISDVRVRSNATEIVALRLSPDIEERVRAVARSEPVDLEKTGSSTRFSAEFLESLPSAGRFYQNVLTLAPGVNDADGDGNPNVHGARTRDFKALVGGVSNVDPLSGEWLSFVHPESIAELEIVTAGAGVEFGRAQGGFARILQKQGGNDFEGVASFIYRTSELDGDGAASVGDGLTPRFSWKQPSLQLSGPIVPDRLWYRLSREQIDAQEPLNLFGVLEVTERSQSTDAHQLTWQASRGNKFSLQYQQSDLEFDNFGLTSTVPLESTQSLDRSGSTWSLTWVAARSAKLLVESVVSYQDFGDTVAPTDPNARQDCLAFFSALSRSRCLDARGGRTSGPFPETSEDRRQRLTVTSEATLYAPDLFGTSHRFKFGFIVENERFFRDLRRTPDMNFRVSRELLDPCPLGGTNPCFQPVGFATVRIPVPENSTARSTGTSLGLYLEDQFRPRDNVTVTAGLRVDREEIQTLGNEPFDPAAESSAFIEAAQSGQQVSFLFPQIFTAFPGVGDFQSELARILGVSVDRVPLSPIAQQSQFWSKSQRVGDIVLADTRVSPRISVAWDPWGDGRTKISASAGRYYDKIFLAVPLVEVEPVSTTLAWTALRDPFLGYFVVGPRVTGLTPAVSVQMVDRDLRTPYQDEYSLAFERAVGQEASVRATFLRRRFRDQLQDVDINHATGDRGRCIVPSVLGALTVTPSPGTGPVVDAYSGATYEDTDPGTGDGIVDDCTGDVIVNEFDTGTFPDTLVTTAAPDGLDDLYVLNPGWGEMLLVGNTNEAEYRAVILEFVRRFYRGWEFNASYTWSRAEGDAEDFDQRLGNERNLRDDERGPLAYDQRHVVRVNAAMLSRRGLRWGTTVRWESGLPYSNLRSKLTTFSVPPEYGSFGDVDARFRLRYPSGSRNDQRNPSSWTVDVRVAKDLAPSRGVGLQVTGEVFNLFNDDAPRVLANLDGSNSGLRRFGRRYQLGLRLAF